MAHRAPEGDDRRRDGLPSGKLPRVATESQRPSYYAIRVCPLAEAPEWWLCARAAAARAPFAIRAILAGRMRVEVSAAEAIAILSWAQGLQGWDPDELTPVWVYPIAPTEA
jgi:hypothetical protein